MEKNPTFNGAVTSSAKQRAAIAKSSKAALPKLKSGDRVVSNLDPTINGVVASVEGRVVKLKGFPGSFAITSLNKV